MSSARSSGPRSIVTRLTAWYALVFFGSVVLLTFVAREQVRASIHARVVATVTATLERHREAFARQGLEGVRRMAEAPTKAAAPYVRIVRRGEVTVFEHAPEPAPSFDAEALRPPASAGQVRSVRARNDGSTWSVGATQLPDGTTLQIAISDEQTRELIGHLRAGLVAAWIVAVVLGLVGGVFFTRRTLRPLARLAATARDVVDSGDLSLRVPERGARDELDALSRLFNEMLARNQALVGGMREALDNVAHDLRTPLTRLRTAAEVALRDGARADQLRDAVAVTLEESDHVLSMLRTLMDVSEAETGVMRLDRVDVDLGELVRGVVALYEDVAEERGVRLITHLSTGAIARCDRNRIHQALANLIDNALKYTPAGGQVDVRTGREDRWALVSVEDSGIGIAAADLPHIWERLYRGDRSRSERGLGLGLSFVKAIVEAHGGLAAVTSKEGAGSIFTIRLPLGGSGAVRAG